MSSFRYFALDPRVILPTILILIASVHAVAQSSAVSAELPTPDPVQKRIDRARALAAAHQLQAAASELENVRASSSDVALRNVTSLMLMAVYLEEGGYTRAQALLDESFQGRAAQKDESIRTYFAMAGQTINGVREHLARYRSYGINVEGELPPEAVADLDRVRALLERMIAQAKEIAQEDGRAYDALALQEDVLGLRLSVARDTDDRDKWQIEYVSAREKLASSQVQVASLGRPPALSAVTSRLQNPFSNQKPDSTNKPDSGGGGVASTGGSTTQPNPATSTSTERPPLVNAAANAAEPKLISTGSLSGRESKRITPVYPTLAKNAAISGTVRVFLIVDENGKVWVTNSEGPAVLRKAAEDAARGWNFPPTVVSGKPVRVAGYIDFEFKR